MLLKQFEQDDPYSLIGHGFPMPEGYDGAGEMARCFVGEYAMMGFSRYRILRLFRSPVYQGPHGVYQLRGEAYVLGLIEEVFGPEEQDSNA